MDQLREISFSNTQLPHRVTEGVNTDGFTDPRDWQTVKGERLQAISLHPFSLGCDLAEWTHAFIGCNSLALLCYFMFVLFSLIILWSWICRGLTLNLSKARIYEILSLVQALMKWYCLPSEVDLYASSARCSRRQKECVEQVYGNAALLNRWTLECFFITL